MRSNRSVPTPDQPIQVAGCKECAGYGWPGYITVWQEQDGVMLPVRRRCPARCTASSRAEVIARQQVRQAVDRPVSPPPVAEPAVEQGEVPAARPAPAKRRPASKASARPVRAERPKPERVAAVAVDVVDGEWTVDTDAVHAPTGKITWDALLAWIGGGLPLGIDRIHRDGKDADGTVVLTAAACSALKVPAKLPTTPAAVARFDGKLRKAAEASGMELSTTLGAGFKAYRRRSAGRHVSVKLIIAPWLGQGDTAAQKSGELVTALAAGVDGAPDGAVLARRLRTFVADLGIGPGATTAVTSTHLVDALRPRTVRVIGEDGRSVSVPRAGALPSGDLAVPPAAGGRHPLTLAERRAGRPVCEEEDYGVFSWTRPLTPDEAEQPFAVVMDVCTSFLSVTETLRLPLGALELRESPTWDKAVAGLWLCDFTGIAVEEDLPHPATFHGLPPEGPGWYATPTVAYMVSEYGFDPSTITRAYLSTDSVPFLKDWTTRIRAAYKRCLAVLGVVDGMGDEEFLTAYAARKLGAADSPEIADALVLIDAYKGIYKGGIGKWTDNGSQYRDDETWAERVAAAWSYRPEVRFTILSAARTGAHRRMRKTRTLNGRAPFAINVDSYLYAAPAASPIPLLPKTAEGKPVPGALRLGGAPGSFKHEASIPMSAVVTAMDEHLHPCRLTHDYDTAGAPVTEEN
ncbi:hypothetical protein ABZX88_34435 [Kitasatospora aureofaciens]|uniref:hypothetical protein n=1 Tax=Kitasatospora aureofaciens TaxID=1894 RepID=UPI0033A6E696